MVGSLREVTGEFARGEAALGTLRSAALAERTDRRLADEILKLIAEWERTPWPASARSRNELRASVKELVPPAPPEPKKREDPTVFMYESGLRGQRRRD